MFGHVLQAQPSKCFIRAQAAARRKETRQVRWRPHICCLFGLCVCVCVCVCVGCVCVCVWVWVYAGFGSTHT